LLKLENLEKQSSKHSSEIQAIFKALKQLVNSPKEEERIRIGYKKDKIK